MSIVNSPAFSLSDVITELGLPTASSLSSCFSNANASGFDATYEGFKDRLSNFRNYSTQGQGVFTITFNSSKDVSSDISNKRQGIFGTSDGTKIFILTNDGIIRKYTMSTAFDITTASLTQSSTNIAVNWGGGGIFGAVSIAFNATGTKVVFTRGYTSAGHIFEHSLGTAYDLSTINYTPTNTVTLTGLTSSDSINSASFTTDGTRLLLSYKNGYTEPFTVYCKNFLFNTGWDISTINNLNGEGVFSVSNNSASTYYDYLQLDIQDKSVGQVYPFIAVHRDNILNQYYGSLNNLFSSTKNAVSSGIYSTNSLELTYLVNSTTLFTVGADGIMRKYIITY